MRILSNKRFAILFLFSAILGQQTAHAGLADWFNNQSFALFRQKAERYLKDPKTYIVAAIAAGGAYLLGREIYWGLKSELPYHRAIDYIRRSFSSAIHNPEDLESIMFKATEHLMREQTTLEEVTFEKRALDAVVNYYRLNYEFYYQQDLAFRGTAYRVGVVDILERSNLVANQIGATCSMRAAFNGTNLFKHYANIPFEGDIFDVLANGPEIHAWKAQLQLEVENTTFDEVKDPDTDEMRSVRRDNVHYNGDQENLDEFSINHIMQNWLHMDQHNYTIIPNMMEFGPELDEHFPRVAQRLQMENNACHVFLLGSMRNYQNEMGEHRGSMGHWIAVVARNSGERIQLFVMDSLREYNTEPRLLERLAGLLNIPHQELQLIYDIEHDFETAHTLCYGDSEAKNKNFTSCLDRIQTIITKSHGQLATATFQNKYRSGIERVLCEIFTRTENETVQALIESLLIQLKLADSITLSMTVGSLPGSAIAVSSSSRFASSSSSSARVDEASLEEDDDDDDDD